jgi:hypothetical protein
LRWWKRSVTTSYIKCAKEKYELDDVNTSVDWMDWKGSHYVWSTDRRRDYLA